MNYVKQKVSYNIVPVSPALKVACLDVLDSLVVATIPDQWVGRRRQTLSVAPLKQLAESVQVQVVHIPEDKDEFANWIPPTPFNESTNANILVTASFGRRIPSSCLDLFHRGRKLNVHPSLLPKYRGAAPIQHALLDGVDVTGVSVIEMEDGKGFDFGDIWAQQAMDVPRGATYVSLEPQLAKLGGQLLIDVLRKAKIDPSFAARLQDHPQATNARLIKAEQSEINWEKWSAERIERTHRAIGHQRPVFTHIPDRHASRLQILEMRPADENEKRPELNIPGETLFESSDNTLRIRCAEGTQLIVSSLKTENKNRLKAKEWWNGIPPIWRENGSLQLGGCARASRQPKLRLRLATGLYVVKLDPNDSEMVLFSLQSQNSEANLGYIIGPQWLHLPILALPGLGTAVLWASMMSHATPTLLSLGMSKSTLSLVFLAGPLSGIIMQPLIGALADASTSKYGRRRPFMMGGCLVCVPAMLGLGFARGIGEVLWSSHAQGIAILISVLSIICIDFSVNAIMAADRALIVDLLPPHEQNSGNAWASRTSGLGQVLGFFIGNLDLPYMFGSSASQIGLLSLIAGLLLLGTHLITAIFVQEAVHQPRPGDASDLKQMLRNMWDTVLKLPATIRSICFIQFLSWLGWLPVMLFATEYIGDIYVRDALDHGDSRGPASEALQEEGTRAGSRALFHGALLTLFASIMLPLFVVSRSEVDHESIGGIVWELSKRLPLELQQKLHKWRETKFDLAKTWAVSHMVFGVLLLCTLLVRGPAFASFIFVLIGLCSAVSAWAPYALLGEAIAAEQQGGRVHGGASQADLDVSLVLLNEAEDWENVQRSEMPPSEQSPQQAGVILGIHNIFIVIPQFVIIAVSSAIFALLDTKQLLHPGGSDSSESLPPGKQAESIGVVFRIGGICSGIAGFFTLQLAKSLRKKYSI